MKILYLSASRGGLIDPASMEEHQLSNTIASIRRKIAAGEADDLAYEQLPDGTTQPVAAERLLEAMSVIADARLKPTEGQYPGPSHGGF